MRRTTRIIDISIVTGALLGLGGVLLAYLGNPVNSGICVSCFMENVAGALQLHGDLRMSYIRPELIGFLLGSFLIALKTGRFRVRGGSSPTIRFFMGFFIIVGCAVFIGCPIKMFLRLAAGDLTAVAATLGLIFGVWIGVRYIKGGFALDGEKDLSRINGFIMPLFAVLLLVFLFSLSQFNFNDINKTISEQPLLLSALKLMCLKSTNHAIILYSFFQVAPKLLKSYLASYNKIS